MNSVQISNFTIEAYETVLALWREAGLILRPGDDLRSIQVKLQRDPDLFLVARDGNMIVGSIIGGWDGRRGWIYHLAVKPSHQRRGIAKALLYEIEIRLSKKGAKKVNAQVYQSNTPSLRFFSACGYDVHSDLVMIGKALND